MPSPKSGVAGSPVPPADPVVPHDADDADPGSVEQAKLFQQENQTGKYGQAQVKPFTPNQDTDDPDAPTSWIEIVLVDEDGNPVPGEAYAITLPDKSVAFGTLDEKGFAREEGFEKGDGQCKVCFTNLDQDAWEPK
jgi:hypothetical protein